MGCGTSLAGQPAELTKTKSDLAVEQIAAADKQRSATNSATGERVEAAKANEEQQPEQPQQGKEEQPQQQTQKPLEDSAEAPQEAPKEAKPAKGIPSDSLFPNPILKMFRKSAGLSNRAGLDQSSVCARIEVTGPNGHTPFFINTDAGEQTSVARDRVGGATVCWRDSVVMRYSVVARESVVAYHSW